MTKQEEIKFLLTTYGIKQSWVAEKIGIKNQTLTFLLNDIEKFDDELYGTIKELIDKYQYDLGFDDHDKTTEELELFDENQLKKGIGNRIRIFAKRKYSTLKKLAEAMDISPQQLQQYISGNREPGSRILIKFMRLGCDINWLLGGSESIESYRIYKLENEIRKLQIALSQIESISSGSIHPHHKEQSGG
ncbi:MAG: helix-turn-helix transcriptional regulator [Melioribacteraceae bacterium]|nr:helix-turn-helix transcriptional regulator [Melioribacteraceae bacterium]